MGGSGTPDFAWIESQIGVLRSRNVAAVVVKQLRLADDPTFVRSGIDPLDKFLARLGWEDPDPKTEPERVDAAIAALIKGLNVQRVGASYLVRIDFKSGNKEQAAKIANAVTDAYIFDQLSAKYQTNRRSTDWLQERLQALREQAAAAERAVIEFKSKNNFVPAGGGALMSEKELSQMSSNLVSARVQTSELQLRLERLEAVRQAYQQDKSKQAAEDETVSEAMGSGIITSLRTQYLELVNREADWSIRYGKNHAAVAKIRNQIQNIRKSMYDELGRIEASTKSDYELAKRRQDELEKGLAGLVSQSTGTNQAQVSLFSLEAAAQSYRKLYDNFLQRHTETVQQQTFPVNEARQVSTATVIQTGPKTLQIWMVTIFAGGLIGAGFGALRELVDRKFRTMEQVQSVLATECLAMVPLLTDAGRKGDFSRRQPRALQPVTTEQLAIGRRPRTICSTSNSMWTVINAPSSPYAEAIRSIKFTVDLNKDTKVVGLTSCLASEGKSTLAAAMATLIAQGGARVILLDCDLRHPSLSRVLAADADTGFAEVVAGKIHLADAIWIDPATQMEFLPAGASVRSASEVLASDAAKSLFDKLQNEYDYVIVDLPPLIAGVDVRATSDLINSYLLVVEWGATKIDAVQYALRAAPSVHANIAGVVLNKVDMATIGRYDRHGASYYYGEPRHLRSVN